MPLISLDNLSRFKNKLTNEIRSVYGEANGLAQLDSNGKVPTTQLPSSVFDVREYETFSAFPATGESGKIYIDGSTRNLFIWRNNDYLSASAPDAIKYISQTLTEAQKEIARNNIGAVCLEDLDVGEANGVAELDSEGLVPEGQLPTSVFNIIEHDDVSEFPQNGETEKIYIDKSSNNMYRWDGNDYINISSPESIKYIAQLLTEEEKAQARENIGAISEADVDDTVRYSAQVLTANEKEQARTNIAAAAAADVSSINSTLSDIQADVQILSENVSDVLKTENGLKIEYANDTSKNITLEADFPLKSVVYDENHYLHFYDANGNDMFDNIFIEGGGGGGGAVGSVKVARITNESINCVYGASVPIVFSVTAKDANDDNATLKGSTWSVNGITVERNVAVSHGQNTFDIGPYLNIGTNTIKIVVTAVGGAENDLTGSKTWQVNAVNMRFEWNYDDTQINTSGFTDTWTVYGDVEKTSHTKLDGTELATTVTSKTGATQSIQIQMLSHGTHTIERWLTATIGGESQRTESQYHEMIFAEAGNTTPIISISMKDFEMKQYDTVRIPVVVYDPSAVLADATLYLDGVEITTWDNIDRSVHYWSYSPTTSGMHTLSVTCGETTKSIHVDVEEVVLDVEEVPGYTFRFKSSEFASNNAVANWNSNGITATFSQNFDWVNGGLHTEINEDESLQQYFCIKAGTRMTINHKLFATDPKARGMTFKIIFKTKNCRSYDTQIMHCFSDVGLRMYAHNAIFNSTGQTITIPYGEDEYSELEFDVYPVGGYRYMMGWMDGVITICRVYDANDSFTHALGSQDNIVIGSDDCDVYIYLVKAYPMLVSRDGHIDNFIMDAPNSTEMARRYNRNDILDEGGDISYTKLMQKNPDCRVWIYDIPYMTNKKKDKVENCTFNQLWKNGSDYYQLSGSGTMTVQGTSSENYVRGAANTDIDFKVLEDGNGNNLLANGTKDETYGNNWFVEDEENPGHAKVFIVQEGDVLGPECVAIERDANRNITKYIKALGFKINDNSCPITYSNTKVNFASCEQVNNMCNAEWYQRYNPYPSLTARDCMEFSMGVQFIKDSGEIPDDAHWVLWGDGKYHMYSIGNMGNSKKNVHVFHDLSNPNEACIEVNDNTLNQMRMVNPEKLTREQYFASEDWSGDYYYGMRYPDTKNPSNDIRTAWYDLVWWFATNNPNDATGEQLSEPETYAPYTFRGHDRSGTQVLRGTTVNQYAGTYTHDTFERRMAKMLSECEDHMVMDSFMYHYIYIERHTMVDNVSKNNFWSTTDLIHWDLSKAYDMDTSDGNNNQGQMKFDYGNEWNDYIGDMKVFNGSDAVWFVFCANLYEACETMFVNREAAGAWSATGYHNFLLSQQQKVPERCWVQCYWYDYLRTYEDAISDEWMTFLDGGQKTHQRKHYEYFEELYDSSKYRGTASTSRKINFRAYTPNSWDAVIINDSGASLHLSTNASSRVLATIPKGGIVSISEKTNTNWRKASYEGTNGYIKLEDIDAVEPEGTVTVTMYNKMYVSVDVGTTLLDPIKAERGVPITIQFPNGYINNMVVNINTATMIQAVSGMEHLYPDTCVFADAVRLRELTIGSNKPGYKNTFLQTLALGNNTMLERLYVQNLPNANSVLDLSRCPALLYIDASGSGFTAYTFADGGLLSEAIINRPTSLSLTNLAFIDDEHFTVADYSALISLRYENTPGIDAYYIVSNATALQIARLIGIDWVMPNSNILNKLLGLQGINENNITIAQSVVAGDAYTSSITQRNLDDYHEAWPDLNVTYDNLVEEFVVRFYNPDGTAVYDRLGNPYIQYVDRGQTIIDPVVNNLIDTPTMESTAQYTYTFDGWENITGPVMSTRNVIASYTSAIRTYKVRWYAQTGLLLKSVDAQYGTEAVYEDSTHTFPPTKTDEEQNLFFSVFKGWNKSTGYVTEDLDVYAVWERASIPEIGQKNLKDMNVAEIYGIASTYRSPDYFDEEDYIDITVGHDFNFNNVTSEVLVTERYFNGNEILKFNDIKLFDENAPSFTLAIDYEFTEASPYKTLISCCDSTGTAEGFKIYYYTQSGSATEDNSVKVLWGDRTDIVAHGLNRGIIVLRHRKGSKTLLVASDNGGAYTEHYRSGGWGLDDGDSVFRYDTYNDSIHYSEVPRAQETITDGVLSFGAQAYGTEGYRDAAKGWIHWCKIWYDDIGSDCVRKLASWPHETWRMQYRGNGHYNKADGGGNPDGASFIANAPLSQFYSYYSDSQTNTTGSWETSQLRSFVNGRCFDALPFEWQSVIRPIAISTKGGYDNPNVVKLTSDKIYVPAYADLANVTTGLYASEGYQTSWMLGNTDRVKFLGITIPDTAQTYTLPNDPTLYTESSNIKDGDIWINSNNTAKCYVYASADTAATHGYYGGRPIDDYTNNIPASGTQGGVWIKATTYWTRSVGDQANGNYHYTVYPSGSITSTWITNTTYRSRGVVLMFSL